jgi:hypothetical protein
VDDEEAAKPDMKLYPVTLLAAILLATTGISVHADGRAGAVEWSDGHKQVGALSLTPGKDLRIFTSTAQVSLQLSEVKEIHFKPEKEEMREGFYFPNAGQATQAKTGEVYPVRYLQTDITLEDGKIIEGHLFTTTFYIENEDATDKIVILAKQTGTNGQKMADLAYPASITFDAPAGPVASVQIDLTTAGLSNIHPPVIVARPDLALLPVEQMDGKPIWNVAWGNPAQILFSVEAADGVHVAWPGAEVDPDIRKAVDYSLKVMQDFYDTRTVLGCFSDVDAGDVYSLVMMKRMGETYSYSADKKPWSLVIFRWKYDPEQKKTTLLNKIALVTGRIEGGAQLPVVLKQPELLKDISAVPK